MSTPAVPLIRLLVLAVLLGGSLAGAAGRVSAQESGLRGDDTYVSPTFGFEVVWAGSWAYLEGSEMEGEISRNHIDLVSADLEAILHITALSQVIDPEEQVATTISNQREDIESTGEEVELLGESSGRGYEAAAIEYTIEEETDRQYIEVSDLQDRAGEDGTLVLQVMAVKAGAADAFADLVDNVTLDGDPILLGDFDETTAGSGPARDEETPEADDTPTTGDDPAEGDSGLAGDTYTDSDHGWSVRFDDRFWEAQETESDRGADLDYRGVQLSADAALATLVVYEDGIDDPADCLADLERVYEAGDVWEDLAPARRLDPPATDRAAEASLSTGTLLLDDGDLDAALYLECRAVDGATLTVVVTVAADGYGDLLPDLEDLLAGIDTDHGGSTRDDDTPEADDEETPDPDDEETPTRDDEARENDPDAGELDGDTFTDTNLGYTVTFDDRVWEGEVLSDANAAGLLLLADVASLVVDASVGYRGVDPDECVDGLAESFGDFDGYSTLDEEPRIDGPTPPRDGAGAVYSFTFTDEDDEEFDRVAYIECRPIDEQTMIRVSLQTNPDLMEDNVDLFQEVLDGIEVDGGSGGVDTDGPLGPDDQDQEA